MNLHTPTQLRQHEAHKARQLKLDPKKPPVKVARTSQYYEETISALQHVIETLRGEIGSMKKVIREKDVTINSLKFDLAKWEGAIPEEVISIREITLRTLRLNYQNVTLPMIMSDDTRRVIVRARQHCYYEVYIGRPDISLVLKSKFFNRDHSTFRHGVKRHCELLGLGFEMPLVEVENDRHT